MSICRANNIALSVLVLISPFPWQPLRAEFDLDRTPVDVEKEEAAKIETNDKSKSPARTLIYKAKSTEQEHLPNPTFSDRH